MPENPTEPTEPLDVRTIHHLVRLMKRYDLTAIDLIEGPTQIRLRRRGPEAGRRCRPPRRRRPRPRRRPPRPRPRRLAPPAPAPPAPARTSSSRARWSAPTTPPAPRRPAVRLRRLGRPPDTTVCVIEAMKVFTDIPAGVSGTITEVLVKNGQPVEFGQPLFRVNPA